MPHHGTHRLFFGGIVLRFPAKPLVFIVSLVVSLAAVESAVRVFDLFPASRHAADTTGDAVDTTDQERPLTKRIPHPFIGWVHRPFDGKHNAFGMPSDITDFRSLQDEDFVIGITGGSFALGTAILGAQEIVERIEAGNPSLAGRVRVIPLALGGYKQPQQLYLVTEALLLGVPLDAIVNIDGFNEIALGCNDSKRGYYPFFPARGYWSQALAFASGELTPKEILATARALQFRQRAAAVHRWLAEADILSRSELIRAYAGTIILRAEAAAVTAEESLSEQTDDNELPPAVAALRKSKPCRSNNCVELIADIWVESSVFLDVECRHANIPYIHFLQPNQYVDGSKPLSVEEREVAYRPEGQWSKAIAQCYSRLVDRKPELLRRGVDFHDLTMIFHGMEKTLYVDDCCHLNETGYRIIGDEVADRLLDRLQ